MKIKLFSLLLILTSLIGYLEWGGGNSMFLFQGEWEILPKLFTNPGAVAHPFIVLPLLGQILLVVNLFLKAPSYALTWIGLGAIGLLLFFMLFIGLIGLNVKIIAFAAPFAICAVWTATVLLRRDRRLM